MNITKIPELKGVTKEQFQHEILPLNKPVVLKQINSHWPAVKAANQSPKILSNYLKKFETGKQIDTIISSPETKGNLFYNDNMVGMNFIRKPQFLTVLIESLYSLQFHPNPPTISMQGVDTHTYLKGFSKYNSISILEKSLTPRFWMGNKVTTRTHFDYHDNIACVVAGKRKFTLFPPEQVKNLYVGPLLYTPAGPSVSQVDVDNPDYDLFPNYKIAQEQSQQATLDSGDAIYIPYLWWHNVKSLSNINVLVNYWWGSYYKDIDLPTPNQCMLYSMLTIPDLPRHQRKIWRDFFDYYVFRIDENPSNNIPNTIQDIVNGLPVDRKNNLKKQLAQALLDSIQSE